jgi:hypothetical protein
MVLFCIPCLALVAYFGIASIFFPKYRMYLREGWRCFMDKLRRKKCSVSFDNRMRLAFSGWLIRHKMVRAGRFINNERNFSITLTVVAVVSTIISIYLFVLFIHYLYNPPCSETTCSV